MLPFRKVCLQGAPWCFATLFLLFCLAFYLPLSSKATNNIFYAGLALPALAWLLWRPSALKALWPFAWLFILLWLMVALDSRDWSDLKKGLYLSLLFVACLLLERRRFDVSLVFTLFALFGLGVLLFVSAHWLWIWAHSGSWVRYGSFLGESINPVYFSMLIISGLVFLWLFHVSDWLERRSRLLLLFGLFLLGALALWCSTLFQARSTLLGFAAFFAGYLLYKRLIIPGFAVAAGLLLVLFGLGGDELLVRRGFSYRPAIWQDAWLRLSAECGLWLGCRDDGYLFLGSFHHPHSAYVSMLYRGGLAGAAALLLFAMLFIRNSLGSRWLLLAFVGWGSLLTTTAGVFTTPQPLWIYFWVPTFMAVLDGQRAVVSAYFDARGAR